MRTRLNKKTDEELIVFANTGLWRLRGSRVKRVLDIVCDRSGTQARKIMADRLSDSVAAGWPATIVRGRHLPKDKQDRYASVR